MDATLSKLEHLKLRIESMTKTQHIEILKILKHNPSVKLNENKSGVYINPSFLSEDVIDLMYSYLSYVDDQESALIQNETQKAEYKNTFFSASA